MYSLKNKIDHLIENNIDKNSNNTLEVSKFNVQDVIDANNDMKSD